MHLSSLLECFYGTYREHSVRAFPDWAEFHGQVPGELRSHSGCLVLVYTSLEHLLTPCQSNRHSAKVYGKIFFIPP